GRAGQKISVTLDAIESDLDPYLVVMAADGTRLGEHDDIDPGVIRNSVVEVTLPADGTYLAIATRFLEAEGFEVGDYRLTVTLEADSLPQQPVDSEHTLSYGASVTGTLNDDQPEERWTFAGQQGDVITLEMTRVFDEPGGLDGYMLLIGPGNETLIEMDDGPDGLMPLVKNYELPAEGTYTVVAARFGFANGFSAGDYTLTLSSAGLPAAGEPGETASGVRWLAAGELPPDLRRATYNNPAAGAISSEDAEDWYMFSGRAGDILTIRMESMGGDLDPFLLLTDSAGYELAQNDDAADSGSDAAINAFELPADGRYLIRATRYGFGNGISSGGYTLLIETDAISVETENDTAALPLDYGQTATGDLVLDEPTAHYTFEAGAGDVITISAQPTEGNLDLGLLLLDPDGEKIAFNSEWLASGEVRLNRIALPAAGTYTLEVALEDFTTSGSYRLILLQDPAVGSDPGAFEPTPGLDIEVVLIWSGGADLDLIITMPDGIVANRAAAAHDFCTDLRTSPVEQAIWPDGNTAAGFYRVEVRYQLNCEGQAGPVQFILALVKNGQVELMGGTLAQPGESYTIPFEYLP
ncbi:MAG: PPC domain-containing protein, partial [Chloroflexi bacterium]|nr:PPC domain-containing protein [Chloroflexota bacterium]